MSYRMLRVVLAGVLVLGCGAEGGDEDRPPEIDSAIAAFQEEQAEQAALTPAPLVLQEDTLRNALNYRCSDGTAVHAVYWVGPGARVVLGTLDTTMSLPQVEAASGAKYETAQPPLTWWSKGDSAQFGWQGRDLSCGRDDSIQF
ncbi:MAG TPA: MliC family protein [Gemmatimonadales bacterium]|nr:MliC family protein [Gemmatimonadales bacterium]